MACSAGDGQDLIAGTREEPSHCNTLSAIPALRSKGHVLVALSIEQLFYRNIQSKLCSLSNSGRLDHATRQAVYEVYRALSTVLACAAGRKSAGAPLVGGCESVIQAAVLLKWDEVHADAALCSAAPWPNAEYVQIVERRAAAEAAAHRPLSDVVRAHLPYFPVDERFRM